MKTTMQAIEAGFKMKFADPASPIRYASFEFGDGYELCIEPLLFGQFMVAVYKDGELLTEKVPVKPIDKEEI